jgi:O-antigen/teichoic acid export membrane protein
MSFTQTIIQKVNNKHFLSLAGNGSMAVFAMLTVAILFRNLSLVQMGSWVFFQTIFTLIDGFRSGFLQTALIKFYSGVAHAKAKLVLGSTWYTAIVITLLFLAINLVLYLILNLLDHVNTDFETAVKWFGITFLMSLPYNVSTWILQADQRFDRLLLLRLINQILLILLVLALIYTENLNLNTVLIANLISLSVTSLFTIIKKWSGIEYWFCRTKNDVKELFHFGKYSVGSMVSSYLLRSSDNFIIMFFLGPAAVAMYNIPLRLMEIIEIPLRSFMATAMPAMSNAFNQNKIQDLTKIMNKYIGLLTFSLLPLSIIAVLLAQYAVSLIGGEKYITTDAVFAYQVLMSFTILYPLDRFLGVTLDIINKPSLNFIKVVLMLVVNIVFDVIGIYSFNSIIGVALASFFTFSVGIIFGYFSLKKYLNFTFSDIWTSSLKEVKLVLNKNFKS